MTSYTLHCCCYRRQCRWSPIYTMLNGGPGLPPMALCLSNGTGSGRHFVALFVWRCICSWLYIHSSVLTSLVSSEYTRCFQVKMRQANYLDNQASNQFSYEAQKCSAGIFTLDIGETGSICATKQSQMTITWPWLLKWVGRAYSMWIMVGI